ncbi:MAG: hypothetical protein IJX98_05485 [Clostridia bacterium]|nr:hypothetical protein [Clostridia bacterium]
MRKELKEKLQGAFAEETPDCKQNVILACEQVTQDPAPVKPSSQGRERQSNFFGRLATALACAFVFILGIFVGSILPVSQTATAETFVYLDVNPSIELSLDENNYVLSCNAANDDAEAVLQNMQLKGVEIKTALNAIVGAMYVKGYLAAEDNSMLISVDTNDAKNTGLFLTYLTDQVNQVFADSDMECSIIAQGVSADEELKRRAEENGVSVGKMQLVEKMIDEIEEFDENSRAQLSQMSIKELNLIYATKPEKEDGKKDDVISGNVGGYVSTNDALATVLTALSIEQNSVEWSKVSALPAHRGDMRMIYAVTLKLKNDYTVYRYEVDCVTGEIVDGNTQGGGEQPNEPNEPNEPNDPNGGFHSGSH